jgi:ankyrin repeat protein
LEIAVEAGHADVVELLLEHGAQVDGGVKGRGREGSPLRAAAYYGRADVAKLLVERGANLNARDAAGRTALHYAAQEGYPDIARLLLEHGAHVNATDASGVAPLHIGLGGRGCDTVSRGPHIVACAKLVKLLLEYGADPNAVDGDGDMPLTWAAGLPADVVKLLLEYGGDPNAVDKHGKTPLAKAANNPQVKSLLELGPQLARARRWQRQQDAGTRLVAEPAFTNEVAAGDADAQAGKLREALQHYCSALQGLPPEAALTDAEKPLREKIIKVVLQLNPAPALPEDAIRHAAYAQAAIEEAQKDASPSHVADAVKEWKEALRIAPWWADGYFNLAAVLKKADRPSEAAQALQLYLLASPNAQNAQDVKIEIYKLEYEAREH